MKKIALVFLFLVASATITNAATTSDVKPTQPVTTISENETPTNKDGVNDKKDDGGTPCCQSATASGTDSYGNLISVTSTHCSSGGCVAAYIMAENKANARLNGIL